MAGTYGLNRYPPTNALATFLDAPDSVYGTGADGNSILDGTNTYSGLSLAGSVYSATRDLHFNNLTISANIRLAPNGYRIFVKNLLTFGAGAVLGYAAGYSTDGSIKQGGAAATAVTHSLGGASSTGQTATAPTASEGGSTYYQVGYQAIRGFSITASGGPYWLRGGAGGTGQPGGGVVIVAARYIAGPSTSSASISAPGTAPAGGGVVIVVSSIGALPASVTTDVTGANAGTSTFINVV